MCIENNVLSLEKIETISMWWIRAFVIIPNDMMKCASFFHLSSAIILPTEVVVVVVVV